MSFGVSVDIREMERAMDAIARESVKADAEIVTANARNILKSVVFNTPRLTGSGRAGWWDGWQALEMPGSPGTNVRPGVPNHVGKRLHYYPKGTVRDERGKVGEASFETTNGTTVVRVGKKSGKRSRPIGYLYLLDQHVHFMDYAAREASWKFGKAYENMLKKHSVLT